MLIVHNTDRIRPLKKFSMSNASVRCGGLGVSRRSGTGDKKVSQRNWGSFDMYVPTYTRLYTHALDSFDIYVCLCVYIYINDLLVYSKSSSTCTYTYIHRCTLCTAWTVLTYTQLADFGSGGDGRRQDKGQSHRAALATMHYFVDIVICSVSFLLLFFGCFVFSILWVYVNRTKM